jgi:two-component system LytT family response regulator
MSAQVRTLLIEDEPGARAEMRWLLQDHPTYTIVGEAATLKEATKLLGSCEYDLVLLDIQLVGGTGFDVVPLVRPGARIIFVTAYDQHALRAFDVNALDYLLKPVSSARLATALARLTAPAAEPPANTPVARLDDRILLKLDGSSARFVSVSELRTIASCENYTEVSLTSGEKLLVRRTMKSWEEILPPSEFCRVHRHAIVALAHIERIERQNRATFEIYLRGSSDPLPLSYRLLADFRARMGARWPEA